MSNSVNNAVNNAAVSQIINQALAVEPVTPGEDITYRLNAAFRKLQSQRRTIDPSSMELAAAEHYMYARFLAAVTGDPLVRYAPVLYGLKKRVLFAIGRGQSMATTAQPVLPPSDDVESWGTKGAAQGLMDYTEVHGSSPANYGQAMRALVDQAGHYK